MAVDKLVDSTLLDNNLVSVANAIREKGKTSESLDFPNGFISAINQLRSAPVITEEDNAAGGTTVTISAPT